MKNLIKVAVLGLACVACLGVDNVSAQPSPDRGSRGSYDPAQYKQRRLDQTKESLEIKDDAEWKAIQPLVEKVMDTQQAVLRDRISGMFGRSSHSIVIEEAAAVPVVAVVIPAIGVGGFAAASVVNPARKPKLCNERSMAKLPILK